jgi:hypothetical protein
VPHGCISARTVIAVRWRVDFEYKVRDVGLLDEEALSRRVVAFVVVGLVEDDNEVRLLRSPHACMHPILDRELVQLLAVGTLGLERLVEVLSKRRIGGLI